MANFILTQGAPAKPFWEHIQDMQFDEADKKAAMQVAHIFCDGGRVHLIRMFDHSFEFWHNKLQEAGFDADGWLPTIECELGRKFERNSERERVACGSESDKKDPPAGPKLLTPGKAVITITSALTLSGNLDSIDTTFADKYLFAKVIYDNTPGINLGRPILSNSVPDLTMRLCQIGVIKYNSLSFDKNFCNRVAFVCRSKHGIYLPRRGKVSQFDRDLGATLQFKAASIRNKPERYPIEVPRVRFEPSFEPIFEPSLSLSLSLPL